MADVMRATTDKNGFDARRRDLSRSATREAIVVGALLSGKTTTEAGKLAGLSRRTVERMRRTESFQKAFKQARSALLSATIDKLRSIGMDSVKVLHEISMNPQARGSDRVLAARHALDLLLRGIETADFSERIAALEAVSITSEQAEK